MAYCAASISTSLDPVLGTSVVVERGSDVVLVMNDDSDDDGDVEDLAPLATDVLALLREAAWICEGEEGEEKNAFF